MVVENDKIGVVRDHRWIKASEQRKRLEAEGCRGILDIGGNATRADVVKMACHGRLFVLVHAFLLGEPKARSKKGGLKADLAAIFKELGKRGAAVKDMETGLTTQTPEHSKAILAVSYAHIARSNQGLKSNLNGAKSKGRPSVWSDPKVRKIIWDEWHSSEHKTNADAVKAAETRLERRVFMATMFRIVKEMRREKGIKDAGGASGRLPGNPVLRDSAYRKRRRVYFMLCGNRVKIGVATKVNGRLSAIQTHNPDKIELLTCLPGDEALESKLHSRFAKLHIRGEWFRYEGALKKYVQSLPKCSGK
jgi:hypothetical protein